MKKYELLQHDTTTTPNGIILYRIRALKDFSIVGRGFLGGYIEKEDNLSHLGDAWVEDNAWVCENAIVADNAVVYENARVFGNALIRGNARVFGDAWVFENAQVSGNAWVCGDARVYGINVVSGNTKLSGNDFITGDVQQNTSNDPSPINIEDLAQEVYSLSNDVTLSTARVVNLLQEKFNFPEHNKEQNEDLIRRYKNTRQGLENLCKEIILVNFSR